MRAVKKLEQSLCLLFVTETVINDSLTFFFLLKKKERCAVDRHFINSFCQLAMHKRFYWLQCQCKKKFFLMLFDEMFKMAVLWMKNEGNLSTAAKVWVSIIKLK